MEYIHVGRVHLGGLSQKPAPRAVSPPTAPTAATPIVAQVGHNSATEAKPQTPDPELTWLDLNDNDLSGPIPSGLGDLSNLEHLYLHDNQLTGPVPADLGRLANLTNLWLRDNGLSGQLPPSLGGLPNLQRVRIVGNDFTGCIPAELLGGLRWYSDAQELGLPACTSNGGR